MLSHASAVGLMTDAYKTKPAKWEKRLANGFDDLNVEIEMSCDPL